ncbi:hypothetical protein C9374_012418 [Naegleria lovaniensis]|uniref:F-box domain-containing protein n=1 Tax=Naegleria lovaniensis TaxID=51637 RepID=A0AA88KQ59_NAELO|nr:uncharacterized protein C9374_012418 [Naegleria lovaniensis]KAG2392166.1 hypothetical protein C9374_012418 [Naegleria lovaniensis]
MRKRKPVLWHLVLNNPYMVLLIFANLDMTTLFGSCSLVCREWYELFFDPSLDDDCGSREQNHHHERTNDESFRKSLLKIVYLNCMAQTMGLKKQWNHYYALDDEVFLHFDEIKSVLLKNDELAAFSQLLSKSDRKKKKKQNTCRKYLTINSVCELIPMIRYPYKALKFSNENSRLVKTTQHTQTNVKSFPLTRWKFALRNDCSFSICHYLMAHTFRVDTKLRLDITCTMTQKSLLTTPISVFNERSISVMKIEMVYHPQFQKRYKNKFNINGKKECYVYSVYLLFAAGGILYLKKYLICDYLSGNVDYVEDVNNYLKPLKLENQIYRSPSQFSFTVGDWDSQTLDIVLFIDHVRQIVYVCVDNMCVCGFTSNEQAQKHKLYLYAPLQVVPFESFNSDRPLLSAYAFNVTRAAQQEGITLANPSHYSDFVLLELKMACHEVSYREDEGFVYAEKFYVAIAKKLECDHQEHPYSIQWKRFSQFLLYKELSFKSYGTDGSPMICAKFIDQGRHLQVKADYYETSYDDNYGIYELTVTYVTHTLVYNSMSCSSNFTSIEDLKGVNNNLTFPHHLVLDTSLNLCIPSFDRAMFATDVLEVLTFDLNSRCALRIDILNKRYELVFF